MKKIIVLIGYPGAGKTTFADAFIKRYPDFKLHDVYEYIKKYKRPDGSLISEEYTITAYTEMYEDLKKRKGNVILELGTNHHDFNAEQLKTIKDSVDLDIFLCLLSKEECLLREEKRERVIDKEAMLKKFERNFPDVHEVALEKIGLRYHYLQMGQPVEEQIQFVEGIIGN